ncbi:MAG: acyl-[acyl-carrier-protein]--UDP-N-acetylglucosamine O-acyltransferase [Gammaproteobacteria bacterium]|nr:MAG: acyl-[acyl-carrier-protein]--UDP-N-acetylglucosamine O-acyltransferase [Gammaproteobacteria bacterium]
MPDRIHPTAIVDPGARLHPSVRVEAYAVIGPDVEIGEGSWIGPHAVIKGPTRIGRENRIFQFASIGEATQALGEDPEQGALEIGDRNTIREYATLNRGSARHRGLTTVGNDCLLMAYTHVAHDCILGDHVIFSNGASIAGHVEVGDWAVLGGFTLVHQFVRIGKHAFSGMGTAINRDVPPYVTVAGNYASAYGINKEGLRRRGFEEKVIRALHRAYMELIKSRQKREQAIERLKPIIEAYPEVAEFVRFVEESRRGVVRAEST